jgi:hypothetical protein
MSHTFGAKDFYGCNGQDRVLPSLNPGTILGAIEAVHNDGPWNPPENFRKLNFRLGYSQGSAEDGFSLAVNGYSGAWTGEQQLAERAIRHHVVDYFGNLDPSDGGDTQRYMFIAEWHGQLTDNSYTKAILYTYYYDLDLFSNFTYFLDNPILGDQFEQKDQRIVSGLTIDHKIFSQWFGRDVINDFGLQVRNEIALSRPAFHPILKIMSNGAVGFARSQACGVTSSRQVLPTSWEDRTEAQQVRCLPAQSCK